MAATPVFATPTNSPLRSSPNVKQFTSTPLHNPIRSSRRSRCISCSDSGQYPSLDLSVEDEDTLEDFPEKYVARSNRSNSLVGRIVDDVLYGSIKYFCRSRGHGFINPDGNPYEDLFVHISDIEGDFVPKKGDRVSYRRCPLPPKFDKFQAVHVHILKCSPLSHRKWESPETPEEIEEDKQIESLPYDI